MERYHVTHAHEQKVLRARGSSDGAKPLMGGRGDPEGHVQYSTTVLYKYIQDSLNSSIIASASQSSTMQDTKNANHVKTLVSIVNMKFTRLPFLPLIFR